MIDLETASIDDFIELNMNFIRYLSKYAGDVERYSNELLARRNLDDAYNKLKMAFALDQQKYRDATSKETCD